MTVASDNPTMDELNSLSYLENVVRETMRVFPPVSFTLREATADDVLPLSKVYHDKHGRAYNTLPYGLMQLAPLPASFDIDAGFGKGQSYAFPLERFIATRKYGETMRTSSGIIGCLRMLNLLMFLMSHRPERWDNMPKAATAIPSVWGNLMTFLAGKQSHPSVKYLTHI